MAQIFFVLTTAFIVLVLVSFVEAGYYMPLYRELRTPGFPRRALLRAGRIHGRKEPEQPPQQPEPVPEPEPISAEDPPKEEFSIPIRELQGLVEQVSPGFSEGWLKNTNVFIEMGAALNQAHVIARLIDAGLVPKVMIEKLKTYFNQIIPNAADFIKFQREKLHVADKLLEKAKVLMDYLNANY